MFIKKILGSLSAFALVAFGLMASPAHAQEEAGTVEAPLPRSQAAPFRIIPVAGASSFTTADEVNTDNFGDGFSAGLLADFGSGFWTFETGILALQSSGTDTGEGSAAIDIDTWGIPLMAKVNFSGKPHETVFLKAGALPFTATGDREEFDVMGAVGVGGHIPLGRNSSLLLDATYNRILSDDAALGDFQGVSLLAGLSFNI